MSAPARARLLALGAGACALALAAMGCVPKRLADAVPTPTPGAGGAAAAAAPTPTPAPQYPQSRPLDEAKPVQVQARRLKYNNKTQRTQFLGGVTVTQDTTELTADELLSGGGGQNAVATGNVRLRDTGRQVLLTGARAEYTAGLRTAAMTGDVHLVSVDPYGRGVTVTADSAQYNAASRTASLEGAVKVSARRGLKATARRADYDEPQGRVTLTGDAQAGQGANRFRADRIGVGVKDGRVLLEGGVKARFIPDEVEQLSKEP